VNAETMGVMPVPAVEDGDTIVGCPFPAETNPHVEAAANHLTLWVAEQGLLGTGRGRDRFVAANFAMFAAMTYPTASEDDLALVADWFAWLFLLDDQLDDGGIGRDPSGSAELMKALFTVLTDTELAPPTRQQPAIVTSLADLWQRTSASQCATWRQRFVEHVVAGGLAAVWESENRASEIVPDESSYVENRRHTGAIYVCMDLIEIVEHVAVPDDIYRSPLFADGLDAACDVVCWTNDVYSLDKEMALGEHHNIVSVIGHHRDLDVPEATAVAVEKIAARTADFIRAERQMVDAWPDHRREVSAYLAGMRSWMRGNRDWSARTLRYRADETGWRPPTSYLDPSIVDPVGSGRGLTGGES
jgi:hypothetical protein